MTTLLLSFIEKRDIANPNYRGLEGGGHRAQSL